MPTTTEIIQALDVVIGDTIMVRPARTLDPNVGHRPTWYGKVEAIFVSPTSRLIKFSTDSGPISIDKFDKVKIIPAERVFSEFVEFWEDQ